MPKRVFRIREEEPLLDIVSYGRGGTPEGGAGLAPEQVEQVRRTVQRMPEVMVKVLAQGGHDASSVARHLDYISRKGHLALETEEDELLRAGSGRDLVEAWDLAQDEERLGGSLSPTRARRAPRPAHKLLFSMPPGTPPEKVRAAVRNLAREEWALQHRYAFVLHTDEPHPHVHLVLKAVSEQGVRLNISKAALRHWRARFAHHLRLLGVAANATERAVRGEGRKARKDGIYRASLRGDSSYMRAQVEAVASEIQGGRIRVEIGKRNLLETRKAVEAGWRAVAGLLARNGHRGISEEVGRFVERMSPVMTERERLASELISRMNQKRVEEPGQVR
jgi:hypothetical protein